MVKIVHKALVVVSHPDPTSLNHALAKALVVAWESCGVPTRLVDLHAIGFDPVMGMEEARGTATENSVVKEHITLLTESRLIGIVHPNCWGAPPAMMKGWMDRVFAPGAAYAFPKGKDDGAAPTGLLRDKCALVLNTSNTSAIREHEVFGDPLDRIWRDCFLAYCGFRSVDRKVYRIVATSSKIERQGWLEDAGRRAIEVAGQLQFATQ